MKRIILFAALALAVPMAQAQTLHYVGEFSTPGTPMAIAADANGSIYYTIFSFAGPDQTRCYFIENPLGDVTESDHELVDDAADTTVPAGRGFHGVAVDANGYVFLTLESGANDSASVRKLSPAPDWEAVDAFFGGVVFAGKRYNGVAIVDEETIVLSTFGSVEFWDANDASELVGIAGGKSFQRSVAYNPATGDVYISRNGQFAQDSVSILRPGAIGDIFTYTEIAPSFIGQGAAATEWGVNGQLITYDAVNDYIIVPDFSVTPARLAFYRPNNPSEAAIILDGAESPNGEFATPAQAAAYTDESGDTFYFITDHGNSRIVIYADAEVSVTGWALF